MSTGYLRWGGWAAVSTPSAAERPPPDSAADEEIQTGSSMQMQCVDASTRQASQSTPSAQAGIELTSPSRQAR